MSHYRCPLLCDVTAQRSVREHEGNTAPVLFTAWVLRALPSSGSIRHIILLYAQLTSHPVCECYTRNFPNIRYINAMRRTCKTPGIWIHVAIWGSYQAPSIWTGIALRLTWRKPCVWIDIARWGIYATPCMWIRIRYVLLASKGMPNRAYVTLCVSNEGPWVGVLNTFELPWFPSTRKTWHLIQMPWFLEHNLVCGVSFLLQHSKGSVGLFGWQVYNIAQIRSSSCL
jgi:hypothetical protein